MEQPLSQLEQFDFAETETLVNLAKQRYLELLKFEQPKVLLCDRDPVQFLAGFVAACSVPCHVFLCNPNWGELEWRQVFELVEPDLIWGDLSGLPELLYRSSKHHFSKQRNLIMIPTGGTSGRIRFAMHTWDTLSASVQGFRQYFEVARVNSFCVLPLYHVSGLMQFLRSFLSNGTFVLQSWKHLDPDFDPHNFFISLVPTQLQKLMPHADWLAKFKTILLGGAPAWSDLLQEARQKRLPIAPTYGMTETASQIATLKPADFLNGVQGCGRVLPHAEITTDHQNLTIRSKSLMLGYYPNLLTEPKFDPDDLGYFDDRQFLHLIGRNSQKIISGGENIFPAEVEAAIRSTNLAQDIYVLGTPDPIWGQCVTAIYVPCDETITIAQIQQALRSRLAAFKSPKRWIKTTQIPRTSQGKIQLDRIEEILKISERSDS